MNLAFFFQGSAVLLPDGIPDEQMDVGIPYDRLGELIKLPDGNLSVDQFEIQAIDNEIMTKGPVIRGVSIPLDVKLPESWRAVQIRQGLSLISNGTLAGKYQAGRLLRAFHIAQWRHDSVFCGVCGTKNTDDAAEQARSCPSCGHLEYPRISPAVITIITNDKDEVILAHNKKFPPRVYSLIAGFNEAGESMEETVAREIREEIGIEVCDITYIVSQPWPFPNSLMLGFKARYSSGEVKPDNVEIDDAQWYSRDTLPPIPGKGSLSRYLIELWLANSL